MLVAKLDSKRFPRASDCVVGRSDPILPSSGMAYSSRFQLLLNSFSNGSCKVQRLNWRPLLHSRRGDGST